jgi:hypothetical protein
MISFLTDVIAGGSGFRIDISMDVFNKPGRHNKPGKESIQIFFKPLMFLVHRFILTKPFSSWELKRRELGRIRAISIGLRLPPESLSRSVSVSYMISVGDLSRITVITTE